MSRVKGCSEKMRGSLTHLVSQSDRQWLGCQKVGLTSQGGVSFKIHHISSHRSSLATSVSCRAPNSCTHIFVLLATHCGFDSLVESKSRNTDLTLHALEKGCKRTTSQGWTDPRLDLTHPDSSRRGLINGVSVLQTFLGTCFVESSSVSNRHSTESFILSPESSRTTTQASKQTMKPVLMTAGDEINECNGGNLAGTHVETRIMHLVQ